MRHSILGFNSISIVCQIKQILRSRLFDFLLIGFLAIMPFFASGTQEMMIPLETVFPLNPSHFLETLGGRWVWQPIVFFGLDFTQSLPFATYYGALAILHNILNIPVALLQRVWSILLIAAAGWSMYFLSSTIIPGFSSKERMACFSTIIPGFSSKKRMACFSTIIPGFSSKKRMACFVSALFYMFNPWLIAIMRAANIGPYVYCVATTPIFLGLLIRGLRSQRNQYVYSILLSFASLSQVLGIQLFIDQAILPALLYFVFCVFTCGSKDSMKRSFKFAGLTVSFSFLINIWWILPSIFDLIPVYAQQAANISTRSVSSVSYLSVFRIFLGSWPFDQYYNSSVGIAVGVVLALLVFSTLLMYNMRDYLGKHVYFFAILAVVMAILMAGNSPPSGALYQFLLFRIPGGIVIFPFDTGKLATTLLIPFAVLLGVSTLGLPRVFEKLRFRSRPIFRKLFSAVIPVVVCVLILLNANPLMTSANLGGLITPVKIPDYYYSTQDWLSKQNSDFRFFVVPSPYIQGQSKYAWAPYSMSDIIYQLPKQPVTNWPGSLLLGKDIVRLIQSKILSSNDTGVGSILGLMNVKYVMIRKDLDPNYHGRYDFDAIEKALLDSGDFSLGPVFGQWSFYENKHFSNSVFVAENIVSVVGSEDALISLAQYKGLTVNSSSFFFLDSLSENERTAALRASSFAFIANSTVDEQIKAEILSSGVRQLYKLDPQTPQIDILKEGTYLVEAPVGQNLDTHLLVAGSVSYLNSTPPVVYLPAGIQTFGMGTDIKNSSVVTGYNGMQVETENSTLNDIVEGSLSTPISTTYGIKFTNSESTWNFTETRKIDFSLYANNTESLSMGVTLHDSNSNYRQWIIPTPQNESWIDVALSLDSPSIGSTEQLDYSKVKSIILYTFISSPANNSYQFLVKTVSALGGNGAFLLSTNSETEPASGISSNVQGKPTNVTYITVNPTLYKVKAETSSPFFLVLSNSYHPMWKVFFEGQNETSPIETNSFANGYFINKTGNYELTIEFVVQRYADMGGLVSILSAAVLAVLVSATLLYRRAHLKKIFKKEPKQ